MKKTSILLLLLITVSMAMVGCGQASGEEFLGKWVGKTRSLYDGKDQFYYMDISRNGESLLVKISATGAKDQINEVLNAGGMAKDGILAYSVSGFTDTVTYVKSENTLRWQNMTFTRVK